MTDLSFSCPPISLPSSSVWIEVESARMWVSGMGEGAQGQCKLVFVLWGCCYLCMCVCVCAFERVRVGGAEGDECALAAREKREWCIHIKKVAERRGRDRVAQNMKPSRAVGGPGATAKGCGERRTMRTRGTSGIQLTCACTHLLLTRQ